MFSIFKRSFVLVLVLCSGMSLANKPAGENNAAAPAVVIKDEKKDENTSRAMGMEMIRFADRLLGTPYHYGGKSTSGFDCSGFVYYVFKNYNIAVPPSSKMLANVGTEVDVKDAQPGDIIIFTGTSPSSREVGHVGLVAENMGNTLKFIHATSATDIHCVTYELLSKPSYTRRFISVRRVIK